MKLSNIDINNLDNELIKKIFFNIKKKNMTMLIILLFMDVI